MRNSNDPDFSHSFSRIASDDDVKPEPGKLIPVEEIAPRLAGICIATVMPIPEEQAAELVFEDGRTLRFRAVNGALEVRLFEPVGFNQF